MARVEGQVAVVTGGASGIRRAAAGLLASEGAAVVIGDLQEQKAAGAPAEIRDAGGRALGLAVDVMDEASLAGLVDAAVSEFGRLDVLCNHAGAATRRRTSTWSAWTSRSSTGRCA